MIPIIIIFLFMLLQVYLLVTRILIVLSFLPLNPVFNTWHSRSVYPTSSSCFLSLYPVQIYFHLTIYFFAFNTMQSPTNLAFFTSCFDFTLCSLPQFLHFSLFLASSSRSCLLQPYGLGNWPVNFPGCLQDINILEMSQASSFDNKSK